MGAVMRPIYIIPSDLTSKERNRFYAKLRAGKNECILWKGGNCNGYGRIKIRGVNYAATRVAWTLQFAKDPGNRMVLHQCDNPLCVNTDHLFLGTYWANMQDCVEKGRISSGRNHYSYLTPERHARGERINTAKVTEKQVREIRKAYVVGQLQIKLAIRYGLTQATISKIVRKDTWRHLC